MDEEKKLKDKIAHYEAERDIFKTFADLMVDILILILILYGINTYYSWPVAIAIIIAYTWLSSISGRLKRIEKKLKIKD